MIIGKILYEKLKSLRNEVRNLKTAHIKTASTISTMTQAVTVNFSLQLDDLSGQIFSTQRAVITLTSADGTEMVSACYLQGITPSNIDDRYIEINTLQPQGGKARYGVAVTVGNFNDYQTLVGGGTVNLSYTLQLVGTSRFTASVSYRPLNGGTL